MNRRLLTLAGAALLLTWVAASAGAQSPPVAAPSGVRAPTGAPKGTPAGIDAWATAFDRMRTADVQDLLYLGEKRPLRIRLHVRIDGKPFRHAWDKFLAQLFADVDLNRDKVLSKEEAVRLPQGQMLQILLQGQFFFGYQGSISAPFAELDANKDGKLTLEEVKAYYRKNGFAPIQTQPDPEQTTSQLLTDALLKLLDKDGDGKMSEKEMKATEESVRTLDVNEDELFPIGELIPGYEYGFGRRILRPAMGGPQVQSLALVQRDDPPAQQVAPLLARYDKDKNGKLSRTEVSLDDAAFTALDTNKDKVLDAKELAPWLAQPADLALLVPLSSPRVSGPSAPTVEKDAAPVMVFNPNGRAMPLAASLRKKGETAQVLTAGTTLVEFQKEQGSQGNFRRLREFYLEQFRGALRGKKYLEKKDAARSQFFKGIFPFLDCNGDGKVTEEEVKVFLDLPSKGAGCFTVVMLSQRGPSLFELLDTNSDKQLGPREFRDAWKNVVAWDANKDSALTKEELPKLFQVKLCAGPPGRGQIIFAVDDEDVKPAGKERASEPLWFRKADVNGDGDVSRREWLGTDEDFRRMDTDGDGLLRLDEALKADEGLRKKLPAAK